VHAFDAHPVTGYIHLLDVVQRPRWLQSWERQRHGKFHWLIELLGEFFGVYFYVYCGVGATVAYNVGNLAKLPGVGSLLTVGLAYTFGIVFAVTICGPVSGGHFNPCVTISRAIWNGFPWKKVLPYIVAQILGSYFACLLIYGQYRTTLIEIEENLIKTGLYDAIQFTPNGVAGIFGLYTMPGANLRDVFMNEFFTDFFLGLVIWGVSDPTNFFVPPQASPWIVAFAYGVAVWGYAPGALAANSARDIGGRLMALTIWGLPAGGGKYAAIAALTNIPATLMATLVYEIVFTDSSRVLPRPHVEFLQGHKAHLDHRALGRSPRGHLEGDSQNSDEKARLNRSITLPDFSLIPSLHAICT